jgi:hypothetical protein
MPLGAKEPNKNYTVYGKFKSPSSSIHWFRKEHLYLGINKVGGLFFLLRSSPIH